MTKRLLDNHILLNNIYAKNMLNYTIPLYRNNKHDHN